MISQIQDPFALLILFFCGFVLFAQFFLKTMPFYGTAIRVGVPLFFVAFLMAAPQGRHEATISNDPRSTEIKQAKALIDQIDLVLANISAAQASLAQTAFENELILVNFSGSSISNSYPNASNADMPHAGAVQISIDNATKEFLKIRNAKDGLVAFRAIQSGISDDGDAKDDAAMKAILQQYYALQLEISILNKRIFSLQADLRDISQDIPGSDASLPMHGNM